MSALDNIAGLQQETGIEQGWSQNLLGSRHGSIAQLCSADLRREQLGPEDAYTAGVIVVRDRHGDRDEMSIV